MNMNMIELEIILACLILLSRNTKRWKVVFASLCVVKVSLIKKVLCVSLDIILVEGDILAVYFRKGVSEPYHEEDFPVRGFAKS